MLRALAIGLAPFVYAAMVMAQTPATSGAQQQRPDQPQASQAQQVTLEGCLYREQDVPGRSPNVAERAGILEDYILADAKPAAGASGAVGTSGREESAAAPAAGKMYKVEHIDDDKLRDLVGKRVQVTGRIDAERDDTRGVGTTGQPQADRTPGPDDVELPEFEAASIREIEGTCPAKPAPVRK